MAKKKNIFKSFSKAVSSVGKTAAVAVGVSSSTRSTSNNNNNSAQITDLTKKLTVSNNNITSLKNDKINLNNKITGLKNEITNLKTNITGLKYNLEKEQTNNTYLNDHVYGHKTKLGSSHLVATQIGKKVAGFANIEPFVEGATSLSDSEITVNLEKVTKENELLEKQIQENSNKFTSDDSKYFYKTKQYDYQFKLNSVFNFFYYILVTILAVVLGFYDRTIHLYVKAAIIFVLLFYPYLIVYLEYLIYIVSKYVYSILYNIPFDMQNDYWFIISSS